MLGLVGLVPDERTAAGHLLGFSLGLAGKKVAPYKGMPPVPWPDHTYMQNSAFYCFKTCADSQAPFSGIADARRRGRPRAPHADLAILRWLPPYPGWGGIE